LPISFLFCCQRRMIRALSCSSRTCQRSFENGLRPFCRTGPLPHPATQRQYSMGGRVGEWAGAAF
jgi:hypothetical protein